MTSRQRSGRGAFHFRWSDGCGAASPPVEEVGPSVVFDAACGGEQGVGSRFRPAAPRLLEPAPDDLLAGAFHDAGSDRHPALPAKVSGIRSLLASNWSMQAATASSRSRRGFRSSMTQAIFPSSDCRLILSIRAFRSPLSGARACTAAAAYSRAWNWSRTPAALRPGRISSQTFRIHAAPSDGTANSSASNTPLQSPNRSKRSANSDVRPAPPSALALSMRTPAAPLPLSFRCSPVFGSWLSAVQRRWPSPRGSSPCRPPACWTGPRPR